MAFFQLLAMTAPLTALLHFHARDNSRFTFQPCTYEIINILKYYCKTIHTLYTVLVQHTLKVILDVKDHVIWHGVFGLAGLCCKTVQTNCSCSWPGPHEVYNHTHCETVQSIRPNQMCSHQFSCETVQNFELLQTFFFLLNQ